MITVNLTHLESYEKFQSDTLNAFIEQGDLEEDISAKEAKRALGDGDELIAMKVLKGIQAYLNSGDESILRILADILQNATREQREFGRRVFNQAGLSLSDYIGGFHNPIHDHMAFLAGERAQESTQRRQFYAQQAEDFSTHFERGFGSRSGGVDESANRQNQPIYIIIDSEEIITPRSVERISDQILANNLNKNTVR